MKKHFIFLGKAGLIYFSWLFVILFIGLIIAYEGTEKINWLSIIIIVIFFAILIYTFWNSYYTEAFIKLPYRTKIKTKISPESIGTWKRLTIEKIHISKFENIYLLRIIKKNK